MMIIKRFNIKYLLILILLITAFLRLYRIDYPKAFVFDEVYHAFTAKEYLKGSKEAWEWWTTPPPNVAYEWTHPPLAKEIMVASMFIFQTEGSWAYRFPGVLLGVISVYLMYLFGMKLFADKRIALLAAFIFSIDGLNFVQSRTGMNDIYFVAFMLASLVFFLNNRLSYSAIFFGLALSSKWTAIYLILVYLILLFQNHQLKKILFFLIIPPIMYILSYSPFFLLGHHFDQFIHLQMQMWWYHTGLQATHTYTSPWWSWPLNLYPVWYFVDYGKGTIANIFASGNPAIFWVGSFAILLTIWDAIKRRSINLIIILLGFFVFWLPWAVSPRIMFLYHFSPSVPFLTLALSYQLYHRSRKLVIILLALMILSFILIYPFLVGLPLPKEVITLFFATNLSKNPF